MGEVGDFLFLCLFLFRQGYEKIRIVVPSSPYLLLLFLFLFSSAVAVVLVFRVSSDGSGGSGAVVSSDNISDQH